jgi:hypothetical protein
MNRRCAIISLLVPLALIPGCGQRTASLVGKVTYQGKPVVDGTVTLIASDGSIHQSGINSEGVYRLEGVPVGLAKVSVSSPDPTPSARARQLSETEGRPRPAPPSLPPGAWFPLPEKYADPATSGLTLHVGRDSPDIDLK